MEEILLKVEHVSKNFGATKALEDVSFTIKKGTIHSLLGRNGAGKSTVVNIIAGIYKQNSGIVTLEGNDITPYSVFERQNMGVKIVPQHASIVPELTVGENVFMGIWPRKKSGFVDWEKLFVDAGEELRKYGLDVDPKEKVRNLNGVDQRKVNIIRAMHGGAKLIILDEPTRGIDVGAKGEIEELIKQISDSGISVLYISSELDELVRECDRIVILHDGRNVGELVNEEINSDAIMNVIASGQIDM